MYKNKKIVAIIPARKNSKEIKKKNIIKLNGLPLISYTIDYAKKSKFIDKVFVSTDGKEIELISKKLGAEVITRPKKLCNDIIMPDHAVVHAIKYLKRMFNYNFDYVVFLQPTTPFRKSNELDKAIRTSRTLFGANMVPANEKGIIQLYKNFLNRKSLWKRFQS